MPSSSIDRQRVDSSSASYNDKPEQVEPVLPEEPPAETTPNDTNDGATELSYIPTYVSVLFNILSGSIWGVLARKGLMTLTSYDGTYLGGVIWANVTACIIMGFLIKSSSIWSAPLSQGGTKASIPIYAGLGVGFCGTCSSFSSVFLEAFNKAANTLPNSVYRYPNPAYGIMECLAVLIAQFGLSTTAFLIGTHIAQGLEGYVLPLRHYKIIDTIFILFGIIAYIITIVLIATESKWRSWTFSVFFAPWGALLRFYLSKLFNKTFDHFPLGTFSANVIGTILLAVFTLLARGKLHASSKTPITTHMISCHVLTGLDDGFCGALTTVSTFVGELYTLRTTYSYMYAFVSMMSAFITMILILGSYNWTVGLTDPICS